MHCKVPFIYIYIFIYISQTPRFSPSTYLITFIPVVCQLLHDEWANYGVMHKYQPVDLIR